MRNETARVTEHVRAALAANTRALGEAGNDPRAAGIARKLWAIQWILRGVDFLAAEVENDAEAYTLARAQEAAEIRDRAASAKD